MSCNFLSNAGCYILCYYVLEFYFIFCILFKNVRVFFCKAVTLSKSDLTRLRLVGGWHRHHPYSGVNANPPPLRQGLPGAPVSMEQPLTDRGPSTLAHGTVTSSLVPLAQPLRASLWESTA